MALTLKAPEVYFPFEPLWSEKPKIARRWYTDVMRTVKAGEQRSSFQTTVIRRMAYKIQTQTVAMRGEITRLLQRYKNAVWGVPIWTYDMSLTAEVPIGGYYLPVGIGGWFYRELALLGGDRLILVNGYDTTEVVTSTLLGALGNIFITPVTTKAWATGTKVYPVMTAKLTKAISGSMITPGYYEMEIEFTESRIAEESES